MSTNQFGLTNFMARRNSFPRATGTQGESFAKMRTLKIEQLSGDTLTVYKLKSMQLSRSRSWRLTKTASLPLVMSAKHIILPLQPLMNPVDSQRGPWTTFGGATPPITKLGLIDLHLIPQLFSNPGKKREPSLGLGPFLVG